MIKSNDNLLCHLIATDEMHNEKIASYKTDELISNPTQIKVAANEVVYIHLIHIKSKKFRLELKTATQVLQLSERNTIDGNCNTIIRCLSDIKITVKPKLNFTVQLVRIKY